MSCNYNAEFANVYTSINYLEGNFNAITGNVLYNYNQLTQIISKQPQIYNIIYYGDGNINTQNVTVNYNANISGNYNINNGNLLINNGNLMISNGGIVLGTNFGSSGQVIVSQGSASEPIWASSLILGSPITLSTSGSPTGTYAEYTNIPPWVNQITITINGMSTNGTTIPNVLLGTSAGYVTSGYLGAIGTDSNYTTINFTTSILVTYDNVTTASVLYSVITLYHMGSNVWVFRVNTAFSNVGTASTGNGNVTLPGTLDRIRLTINGTQLFDAGTINIRYQ
jgi:hypothetical protein